MVLAVLKLRRLAKRRNLSWAEIARGVGCSAVTISLIMSTQKDRRRHVSALLALRLEEFFDGEIRAEELPMTPRARAELLALRDRGIGRPTESAA